MRSFRWFKIEQVPRTKNVEADSLARLAFGFEDGTIGQKPIEILSEPSINDSTYHVMPVDNSPSWVDMILEYLMKGQVPEDKNEARRIRYQANRYTVMNGKLYRWEYAMPYLRCLRPDEADYVMREFHERVCGNHSRKMSLA